MSAMAAEPPSRPGLDAPELARLGNLAVGVKTIVLVDRDQLDLPALDPKTGIAPKHDRSLTVDIWYPARSGQWRDSRNLFGQHGFRTARAAAKFQLPGIAVRDAPADAGKFPLVVVAHGYGNVTVGMSWLTENLASKGYVVAAIRHEDRISIRRDFRTRCCAARSTSRSLRANCSDAWRFRQRRPARTALIGYSMGGYGVLTAGGAALDPAAPSPDSPEAS